VGRGGWAAGGAPPLPPESAFALRGLESRAPMKILHWNGEGCAGMVRAALEWRGLHWNGDGCEHYFVKQATGLQAGPR
jgi:hypothetical protein